MALFANVERVAIIGAKAQIGRLAFGQKPHHRRQIFRHRPFADQNPHPLAQLFQAFGVRCRLMLRSDPCRDIAVQIIAQQQRRVAVDVATGESL